MDHSDYTWRIAVRFDPDASYDLIRQFLGALDAAVVRGAEQTICQNGDVGITVEVDCGRDEETERRIMLRRAYQIAEVPDSVDATAYSSAGAAIEHLRALRSVAKAEIAQRLTVVRDPDGSYRVGNQAPDACDFTSQAAAEEALAAFEDRGCFAVMPYVEITTERDPKENRG